MTLGEVIAKYRSDHNLSMDKFAELSGISKGYISMLERNQTQRGEEPSPSIEMYRNVARVIGVEMDELLRSVEGNVSLDPIPKNVLPMPKMRKIPLLGTIACGEPILAAENIDGEVDIPDNIQADFALRCRGDSMINARVFDGDIVYIKQQDIVDNGDIAAVLIDDEATLKRVHLFEDHIVLNPENPMYKPFVYWGEEMNSIRILGKAVAFYQRYEMKKGENNMVKRIAALILSTLLVCGLFTGCSKNSNQETETPATTVPTLETTSIAESSTAAPTTVPTEEPTKETIIVGNLLFAVDDSMIIEMTPEGVVVVGLKPEGTVLCIYARDLSETSFTDELIDLDMELSRRAFMDGLDISNEQPYSTEIADFTATGVSYDEVVANGNSQFGAVVNFYDGQYSYTSRIMAPSAEAITRAETFFFEVGCANNPTEPTSNNPLIATGIEEKPVVNGSGTASIGVYGVVRIDKLDLKEITKEQFGEFCETMLDPQKYNWVSIVCEDGTGIQFPGCIAMLGTYGELDGEGCITKDIGYITPTGDGYTYQPA